MIDKTKKLYDEGNYKEVIEQIEEFIDSNGNWIENILSLFTYDRKEILEKIMEMHSYDNIKRTKDQVSDIANLLKNKSFKFKFFENPTEDKDQRYKVSSMTLNKQFYPSMDQTSLNENDISFIIYGGVSHPDLSIYNCVLCSLIPEFSELVDKKYFPSLSQEYINAVKEHNPKAVGEVAISSGTKGYYHNLLWSSENGIPKNIFYFIPRLLSYSFSAMWNLFPRIAYMNHGR